MNTDLMFSSKSNEWQTPKNLFNYWNNIYKFDIDVAATKGNALCQNYYTKELDCLKQHWAKDGKTFWMNSPYGRELPKFIKKAYDESFLGCITVCLLPSRSDTKFFHQYIMDAAEIHFIKGRIKFIDPNNPTKLAPAPFGSLIAIFDNKKFIQNGCKFYSFDQNLLTKQ